jgi:serralysin
VNYSLVTHANVENISLVGTAVLANGNSLANAITGNGVANFLNGFGGDDRLRGNGENDALYGGSGNDTAVFSGNRADYVISLLPNGDVTVADQRPGAPDGTRSTL